MNKFVNFPPNLFIHLNGFDLLKNELTNLQNKRKLNVACIYLCFMYRFIKVGYIAFTFIFLVSILDSCKSRGPYNPYLKMKTKPNKMQLDADKKAIKKGNRAYKRQLGNNRYHLFGRRKPKGA